jgi:hypothetical protein
MAAFARMATVDILSPKFVIGAVFVLCSEIILLAEKSTNQPIHSELIIESSPVISCKGKAVDVNRLFRNQYWPSGIGRACCSVMVSE